jgi:hypothetical protein
VNDVASNVIEHIYCVSESQARHKGLRMIYEARFKCIPIGVTEERLEESPNISPRLALTPIVIVKFSDVLGTHQKKYKPKRLRTRPDSRNIV